MIAPSVINARSYKSVFTFAVISDIDNSITFGRIVDKSEIPRLNVNPTQNMSEEIDINEDK